MVNIYYQNVRGLRTKTSTFFRNICLNSYDIVCLTETWLIEGINDSELFDDRYLVWRRDRDYVKTGQVMGGGVLIAVRRGIAAEVRSDWCSNAEDLWVTLILRCQKPKVTYKLHLCTIYICNQNLGSSLSAQLTHFSEQVSDIVLNNPCDKFIIVGDFNMPNLIWKESDECFTTYVAENIQGTHQFDLLDNLNLCNLSQYNFISNNNNRILDLILSNSNVSINRCDTLLVPEDNHHPAILVCTDFLQPHILKNRSYTKYLYQLGDYDSINLKINEINWQQELKKRSVANAVHYFYDVLDNLRKNYIPSKISTPMRKYPPWYKKSLIKILKEKHKYHAKYKKYGNQHDLQSFNILRYRANELEKDMFRDYITTIENNISNNPRSFWSYVKTKNGNNLYPAILHYGQKSSNCGEDICNMFSEYFHSTFSNHKQDHSFDDIIDKNLTVTDIEKIEIVKEEVYELLKTLDLSKTAGPDNIPAIFIIKCARSLSTPLTNLFERSLSEGVVPVIWKSAYITPIHKKGPKNDVVNYRPISKLCLFAKILEKIIHGQVYASLKHTFSDEQHGFLKGRSTTSNLILCSDYLSEHMSKPSQVDVVYTDYSKCFDSIDHLLLLRKLQCVGIRGNLYRWFTSYVQNRYQTVVLNGYTSRSLHIPSGVPQGSLLGPLLFNIYVNDIAKCLKSSKILIYADDMKILFPINSIEDAQQLQDDLIRLEHYCFNNKLNLNVSKCYICSYTRKPYPIIFDYKLKNNNVTRVNFIRDLGITFDSKLLFDDHINNIVNKASRALGFILRISSDFNSIKTLKILYCAFVRSNLEYVSQVWNPNYNIYISRIERIQERFIRYLQFKVKTYLPDYIKRCQKFHILPLYERRLIADLAYLLNIANASIDCPELLGYVGLRVPCASLRRHCMLQVPGVNTNYRQNSYLLRASRCFNEIARQQDIDLFNTSARQLKCLLHNRFFIFKH